MRAVNSLTEWRTWIDSKARGMLHGLKCMRSALTCIIQRMPIFSQNITG